MAKKRHKHSVHQGSTMHHYVAEIEQKRDQKSKRTRRLILLAIGCGLALGLYGLVRVFF